MNIGIEPKIINKLTLITAINSINNMSLKQKILTYLEGKEFVHKGELGRLAVLEWGYENENLGRRCRELENEKKIVKRLNDKREVMYKIAPQDTQADLKPVKHETDAKYQMSAFQLADERLKANDPYSY
jgi:hypothetical protein